MMRLCPFCCCHPTATSACHVAEAWALIGCRSCLIHETAASMQTRFFGVCQTFVLLGLLRGAGRASVLGRLSMAMASLRLLRCIATPPPASFAASVERF